MFINSRKIYTELINLQQQLESVNHPIKNLTPSKIVSFKTVSGILQILKDIQRQEQENAIWAKLDMLIGSADGKKIPKLCARV